MRFKLSLTMVPGCPTPYGRVPDDTAWANGRADLTLNQHLSSHRMRTTFQLVLGAGTILLATQTAFAQSWFGLPLPTGLSDPDQPVMIIGTDFAPFPVVYPPGVQRQTELQADRIFEDVKTITGFAKASRARGERLWGRIAGMPALLDTNDWVATQFRNAGIAQVAVEQHTGSLTLPTS